MKKYWLALVLGCAVLPVLTGCNELKELVGLGKNKLKANEIAVGDQQAKVVDYYAKFSDKAKNTKDINVYFFTKKLTDDQKTELAANDELSDDDVQEITGGQKSVLMVKLQFTARAEKCGSEALKSVTVRFNKNDSFDFDVINNTPLNWTFAKSLDEPISELGFDKLSCSFEDNGKLVFQLTNHWLADKRTLKDLLPDEVDELDFRWNLDVSTKLLDANDVKKVVDDQLQFDNTMIKGASISWISEQNILAIRTFSKDMSKAERVLAGGYPPQYKPADALVEFYIYYNSKPANFSELPKRVKMTVFRKQEGLFYSKDYDIEPSMIYASGEPKVGSDVVFQSKAELQGDSMQDMPPVKINLNILGPIDKSN